MSTPRPRAARAALAAAATLLAGCPDEPRNPATLWLAPDGSELRLRLIDREPDPF